MVSKKKHNDCIPPGWKLEIKVTNSRKVKCYINSKTHKKVYSKLAMLRYIKDKSIGNGSSTKKANAHKSSGKKEFHVAEAGDLYGWLPSGWIIESRTRKSGQRKGDKYKCFIDPTTSSIFFSKPEVYRYLESVQRNAGSSQLKKKGSSKNSSNNKSIDSPSPSKSCLESNVSQLSKTRVTKSDSLGNRKVVVERTIDDDLPPGWIKEIRNKMIGERVVGSNLLFIDPTAGFVFRSKSDVVRYIRNGEDSRHGYRRKTRSMDDKTLASLKTSPPSSNEREKATTTATRKLLFVDEISPKCIPALPEASSIKETGSKRITRSASRAGLASVHEAKVTKHRTQVALPKFQDANVKKDDPTHPKSKASTSYMLIEEKPETVAMKGRSNEKAQTANRKIKGRTTPNWPSRSSKRLAGVDVEVVFNTIPIEHTFRTTGRKSGKPPPSPKPGSIPSESQEKPHDVIAHDAPLSHEGKLRPLDVNAHTVVATQEVSSNKFNIFPQSNAQELDIDMQERYPPGFSQNVRPEALPINIDQSLVYPKETPAGKQSLTKEQPETPNKIQKSSGSCLTLEEQQGTCTKSRIEKKTGDFIVHLEQAATAERDIEKPDSQICFTLPIWSDPCLEFAYKTLTGALPLDDNLAIQDYIQHQIRTSKPSNSNRSLPDMGLPSFLQSNETKSTTPLKPEEVSIPKTNGFSSQIPSK